MPLNKFLSDVHLTIYVEEDCKNLVKSYNSEETENMTKKEDKYFIS